MSPKAERLQRILEKIKPKTYYEELAEYGYLAKYVEDFVKVEYESDDEFREDIMRLLLKYSSDPIPEIEDLYLSMLSEVLEDFQQKSGFKAEKL